MKAASGAPMRLRGMGDVPYPRIAVYLKQENRIEFSREGNDDDRNRDRYRRDMHGCRDL